MRRERHRWYSDRIGRELGVVVVGHWGPPMIMFPTSGGDAEEYERQSMIGAIGEFIDAGRVKAFCVDVNHHDSFGNGGAHPFHRSWMQRQYDAYIRQEVILANVGPHGEGYVNYLLTVFFFLLACNLLGLLPWSATPTSNIAVTGAMAGVSLVVIEISGMRALGLKGYLGTIFFLPEGLPTLLKPLMLVIMTPIEIIGKLAKPFALAVRLFANMTAGHVVVLALIGLTFFFQSYLVGVAASAMATGIMLLELFVAFLQAFVFTLLTSVFIGLMRAAH